MSPDQATCIPNDPPNQPPNAPAILSPANGSATLNTAPTLCWQNQGDPENNPLEYQVEIFDSPINLSSAWTRNTCWRPAALDWQYHTYQWRVKARDPLLAESGWSAPRTFTVQSPNIPPSIAFNTANGNDFSSGVIYSRDTNWTFTGTASDPEEQLNRVEWRCSGDGCGATSAHSGAASWSHTQTGMSGRNNVYFVAYDDFGNNTYSRHLDLRIDLAAPSTTPSLNGESSAAHWPVWFTGPVQVQLHASDNPTGSALAGMGQVFYRLDGGGWQSQNGSDVAFTVNTDGQHTLEYYAVDALGNTAEQGSLAFQIDQTPPTPPAGVEEVHGVMSNLWQREDSVPAFTWQPSTDNASGVLGYQFYFGLDAQGNGYDNILASAPLQYNPYPSGVHTGTYYLRGRTQDVAGNWSAWTDLFTFLYDGTPPENPADVTHSLGITATWQNLSNLADFAWPVPHDEGSGVQGYYVYWGTNPTFTTTQFITTPAYQSGTPLCALDAACTGYLRLRSADNAGNLAEDWTTAFVLRYDNAPPVVDFTFNGGVTNTVQTQVTLVITATDEGSGVYAFRFSADGVNWGEWEAPVERRSWLIPAISRQWWPVYVQVQDRVGLLSQVAIHEIYLDVNAGQPISDNYRLFDKTISGGAGAYASGSFSGRGTLGQVFDSPTVSSTHYLLANGFEAGSQAIPLIIPGYEEYSFINGVFASGVVAETLTSPSFHLIFTTGEIGLPATPTITSASFLHQPGFLAAAPSPVVFEDPSIVPPPDEDPVLSCEAPSLRINEGAAYTVSAEVTLSLCAPYAVEMKISNFEDFSGASWEPYVESKPWLIPTTGAYTVPRYVYAIFKEANGRLHSVYFDDILYDPTQPSGQLLLSDSIQPESLALLASSLAGGLPYGTSMYAPLAPDANPDGSITLYVDAHDDNSGIFEMQFSEDPEFTNAVWEPYASTKQWSAPEEGYKTVYVRFRDSAGNLSGGSSLNFLYDVNAPIGGVYFDPQVVGSDAITATLYPIAYDGYYEDTGEITGTLPYVGVVSELRLSLEPTFGTAYWQLFTYAITLPISTTTSTAIYIQYRDLAGNISEVYSDTLLVDIAPPVVTATADPAAGLTRQVHLYAFDDQAGVQTVYLSNDPLMVEGVVSQPYASLFEWTFDEHKVLWVVVEDAVGNRSEPYPVYATDPMYVLYQVYSPLVLR